MSQSSALEYGSEPHDPGPVHEVSEPRPLPPAPDPVVLRLQRRIWIERGVFGVVLALLLMPYLASATGSGHWSLMYEGRRVAVLAGRSEAQRALALVAERTGLDLEKLSRHVRLTRGGGGPLQPNAAAAAGAVLAGLAPRLPRGVIYVDGQPVIALPSPGDAEAVLNELKARATSGIAEPETEPGFAQEIVIREEPAPQELWCTRVEEAVTRLTGSAPTPGEEYTVKPGDVGGTIARAHGLTLAQLEALNPGVVWTRLQVGQKLRVGGAPVPRITVVASGIEREQIPVPYPTIRKRDPDLPRGEKRLVQEGKPGVDECVFVVDYVDGKPIGERRLERRERVEEPQARIVHVGTGRR